jgi:hypothetical protein
MKLNELITSFEIFVTNEERSLLETFTKPLPLSSFDERDQVIINNLIRKSVISKLLHNGTVMVMPNEF